MKKIFLIFVVLFASSLSYAGTLSQYAVVNQDSELSKGAGTKVTPATGVVVDLFSYCKAVSETSESELITFKTQADLQNFVGYAKANKAACCGPNSANASQICGTIPYFLTGESASATCANGSTATYTCTGSAASNQGTWQVSVVAPPPPAPTPTPPPVTPPPPPQNCAWGNLTYADNLHIESNKIAAVLFLVNTFMPSAEACAVPTPNCMFISQSCSAAGATKTVSVPPKGWSGPGYPCACVRATVTCICN